MIETLPDGRRRYTYPDGTVKLYTPRPRASGPRASGQAGTYQGHHWKPALALLPDAQRAMPETVPHEVVAAHVFGCECAACARYGALATRLKRQARGLRA